MKTEQKLSNELEEEFFRDGIKATETIAECINTLLIHYDVETESLVEHQKKLSPELVDQIYKEMSNQRYDVKKLEERLA